MISNYRPARHKTMFIYLTDGSLKIFFQGQCWFLGIFPVCADSRTEHPARGPKRLHLVEMGTGEKRQAWKFFLKAKGNIEKGKEETTSLSFGVTSLAIPCNLGKEVVACERAQSLGAGHSGGVFLLAGHLLRASINDMPKAATGVTGNGPALRTPLFLLRCPLLPSLLCMYLAGQRPLLYSLIQALLGHKKPHCIQTKTEKVGDFL